MNINQRGFTHLFLLLILLIGIVVGVYLVQTKTNLFPKASEETAISLTPYVQFVDKSGKEIFETDTQAVKIKLTDPKISSACDPKRFDPATWDIRSNKECKKGKTDATFTCLNKSKKLKIDCPIPTSIPKLTSRITQIIFAEDSQFTKNILKVDPKVIQFDLNSSPFIADYSLSYSPESGKKDLFVKFITQDSQTKTFSSAVNYIKPSPPANTQPVVWKEDWTDPSYLKRWTPVTDDCFSVSGGIMEMKNCAAGGIISKQKWNRDYEIIVEGTVSAQNSIPSNEPPLKPYWGGLTLFNGYQSNIRGDDSRYAEFAVANSVNPQSRSEDKIIILTDEYQTKLKLLDNTITPGNFYKFKIVSKDRQYFYYLDNQLVDQAPSNMLDNPNIFLLCVSSAGKAISRANCKFGPITVTGVSSNFEPDYSQSTLQVSPSQVKEGQNITVSWQNIPNPGQTDWLGVIPSENSQTYYGWSFVANCSQVNPSTSPLESGFCTFSIGKAPPGKYEVNYFLQNTHQSVSKTSLTVTP